MFSTLFQDCFSSLIYIYTISSQIGKKIANGSFGQLRLGKDQEDDEDVAIKLEPTGTRIPMLAMEFKQDIIKELLKN